MQLLFSFDQDMRVEKTLTQTLACQFSSLLTQLLPCLIGTRKLKNVSKTATPRLQCSAVANCTTKLHASCYEIIACLCVRTNDPVAKATLKADESREASVWTGVFLNAHVPIVEILKRVN